MSTRVYVGNLPLDVREREIDDLFYKFGRIRDMDLHRPMRPPAYCFIDFDDPRDAEDAVRQRHGSEFAGDRLRVEFTRSRGERTRPTLRRGDYAVRVSNLPRSISWQDLKDHMRDAGDICFADVFRDGTGLVEFSRREDMEYALRKLDKSEIRNAHDRGVIRVRQAGGKHASRSRSRSRSKSKSASRSRSRSHSRSRSRSKSASRSPSPRRKRSPSPAKSGSRSRSRSPAEESRKRPASPNGDERSPKRARGDDDDDKQD